ncbi:MAG: alpha/beta hydrolase [Gammaproteobacteria bacterium]|nr:alpha/beta hydrolase [Gammaproteobacteria bacterium]
MGHFAQVNGIRLHYLDHKGGDPVLVLMPGLTSNAQSFDGLVGAGLSPALRVLALDLRGRGLSDKPVSGYSLAAHAADVIGLLDVLGLERVVLGGHSFGGLLGFYMADRFPERVERLVVIDAAGTMHPQTRSMIQPSIDRLGRALPSWESYLTLMKGMPFYRDWWNPTIESFLRADVETQFDGGVIPRSRPEAIIEVVDHVLAEDWMAHIDTIEQPVLLLRGRDPFGLPGAPPLLPKAEALETVGRLANGHYAEVTGNHITMLYGEGAVSIVAEIVRFLDVVDQH